MPLTNDQLGRRVTWLFILVAILFLGTGYAAIGHFRLHRWAANTNDPAVPDYNAGGLTSYLGDLAEKLTHHIEQAPEQGHGHPDQHREPPPPPDW